MPVWAFAPAEARFPLVTPASGAAPEPALGVLLPGLGVVLSDGDGDEDEVPLLGLVVVAVGEVDVLAGLLVGAWNRGLGFGQAGVRPDEFSAVG